MRRLPRIQHLRCPTITASPTTPARSSPFRRSLSTTRPARFTSARRCLDSAADEKKRQEMLEALERDRQAALELQSQYEGASPKQADLYVPSTTAEDLEEVGGLENWWEQDGHWGAVDGLRLFSAPRNDAGAKVTDPSVLEGEEMLMGRWAGLEKQSTLNAAAVELQVSEGGDITLTGDLGAVLAGLETPVQEVEAAAAEEASAEAAAEGEQEVGEAIPDEVLTAEEARELTKSWDRSWQQIALANPALKFAVHKRLYQLSGQYIPDAKLAPKARKLIDVIQQQHQRAQADASKAGNDLLNLPNVKVYSRRVTPIDKEVWVGRWKVIEAELRKRDLPITGTGKYGKAKERAWLMGKP
ncbi:unnamed protein product [Parascedosporium putredinis]|uniref:Large ribosomal subunit protein mL50 n=1 Tax=Parascedosporium putredinis TaxID=1442378 RepID=A0A9P1M9K7_9PEZI|nr:unnamed protein product [Parascedosporium putredinis]CAI7992262.1 unnamed protein product [Parascedosporium putredinis]